MSNERKIVKVVTSGVPDIYPHVDIYDSVLNHIRENHPEEFARLDSIYETIEKPDRIHKSKTNPRSVVLINQDCTSESSGDPLRVIVKNVDDAEAILSTAYFSSAPDHGALLWPIEEDE